MLLLLSKHLDLMNKLLQQTEWICKIDTEDDLNATHAGCRHDISTRAKNQVLEQPKAASKDK